MTILNTTRRYPRTASEAFRGADYAGPITTPTGRVIAFPSFVPPRKTFLQRLKEILK